MEEIPPEIYEEFIFIHLSKYEIIRTRRINKFFYKLFYRKYADIIGDIIGVRHLLDKNDQLIRDCSLDTYKYYYHYRCINSYGAYSSVHMDKIIKYDSVNILEWYIDKINWINRIKLKNMFNICLDNYSPKCFAYLLDYNRKLAETIIKDLDVGKCANYEIIMMVEKYRKISIKEKDEMCTIILKKSPFDIRLINYLFSEPKCKEKILREVDTYRIMLTSNYVGAYTDLENDYFYCKFIVDEGIKIGAKQNIEYYCYNYNLNVIGARLVWHYFSVNLYVERESIIKSAIKANKYKKIIYVSEKLGIKLSKEELKGIIKCSFAFNDLEFIKELVKKYLSEIKEILYLNSFIDEYCASFDYRIVLLLLNAKKYDTSFLMTFYKKLSKMRNTTKLDFEFRKAIYRKIIYNNKNKL